MTLSPYHSAYVEIAQAWNLPWALLEAQGWKETAYTWNSNTVGPRGERGLGQIMLKTWADIWRYDVDPPSFDCAFEPRLSIEAQARYLNWARGLVWQKYPGSWVRLLESYPRGVQTVLNGKATPAVVQEYIEQILHKAVELELEELRERRMKDWLP